MKKISRRSFTHQLSTGIAGVALASGMPWACAMDVKKPQMSLGVALVGLGSYSTYQLAPALQQTKYCHLAGIVTGTPAKEKQWATKYGVEEKNIYNYRNFDNIINDSDIDIVYVVLPNSMHAEFSIRAARAGKHVICEKPMAISVEECDAIIDACQEAGVRLGMGYRLHSEPYTREIKRFVREKTFGNTLHVTAEAAYRSSGSPGQWRLNRSLSGGGALMNMGVYAIQSAIYCTGKNPISVTAQEFSTRPEYFKDTDETITAQFEFDSDTTAEIMTSHNKWGNNLRAKCSEGWFELDPASSYGPLKGKTSAGILKFPHESQQKLQMDDFARHILQDKTNRAPGEMGKRDMIIVEAIYKSVAMGGKKISLNLGALGLAGD
ncbi:MAG: Gfo/Idh/MocA family oxidoreductase [Flavobacteriaceae bacterium]